MALKAVLSCRLDMTGLKGRQLYLYAMEKENKLPTNWMMTLIIHVRNVECEEIGISESMNYRKYRADNRLEHSACTISLNTHRILKSKCHQPHFIDKNNKMQRN